MKFMNKDQILNSLGLDQNTLSAGHLEVFTPIDGSKLASVKTHKPQDVDAVIVRSCEAFKLWREVPAPRRGDNLWVQ